MTRLVLTFVRHGETLENRNKIIQGQLNTHLNELGRRQSEAVAIALKDVPFQRAFSSDLNRAKETAEAILKFHDIPLELNRALREKSFGAAEGHPYGAKVIGDKGELPLQFRKRYMGWWQDTIAALLEESPEDTALHILVVGHGAFIRSMFQALITDQSYEIDSSSVGEKLGIMPNTGITVVEVDEVHVGRLVVWGEESHLKSFGGENLEVKVLFDNVDDLAP